MIRDVTVMFQLKENAKSILSYQLIEYDKKHVGVNKIIKKLPVSRLLAVKLVIIFFIIKNKQKTSYILCVNKSIQRKDRVAIDAY